MSELTVLLPAYNEEENLEVLVNHWQGYRERILADYGLYLNIIAVNDGSRDGTGEIGERLSRSLDNFVMINHAGNKGLGQAVKTGIVHILENCRESVFTCIMDCDNTHSPGYILDLLEEQRKTSADVVVASRYQTGSTVKGLSFFRLFLSEGARYVYSFLLGVEKVRDYTCGYRLYSNGLLKQAYLRFGEQLVEESGFTCMAELLYKLHACGGTFSEVPFELRYDLKGGASKMKVVKTAVGSIALALRLKRIPRSERAEAPVEYVTKGDGL